jgi:hypothetical protein
MLDSILTSITQSCQVEFVYFPFAYRVCMMITPAHG